MRAPSTAASTVECAGFLEYSIWWAALTSSARSSGASLSGRSSSGSIAGARRRYQRTVPSVMARIAARSGALSNEASASSADRPLSAMRATARAADASVSAPGAQRPLPRLGVPRSGGRLFMVSSTEHAPDQCSGVRKVPRGDGAPPGSLHFVNGELTLTALNEQRRERTRDHRINSPSVERCIDKGKHGAGTRPRFSRNRGRSQDAQLLAVVTGLGDGPGIEGAHLALDLDGRRRPIDAGLCLF